jgi:hypothetical protein
MLFFMYLARCGMNCEGGMSCGVGMVCFCLPLVGWVFSSVFHVASYKVFVCAHG